MAKYSHSFFGYLDLAAIHGTAKPGIINLFPLYFSYIWWYSIKDSGHFEANGALIVFLGFYTVVWIKNIIPTPSPLPKSASSLLISKYGYWQYKTAYWQF